MDERDFVTKKRETWERLAGIVGKAGGRGGARALNREELLALGPLYRRVCSDLGYARAHAVSEDLVAHLNGLAGQAHALLYEAETSGQAARSVLNFYIYDFPALLQHHVRYFLAAFGITLLGAFYAYWFVSVHPDQSEVFIPPQFKQSVEKWKEGGVQHDSSTEFSGQLFTNNQRVGLIAYATGVVAGVPTVYLLFYNGATVGALSAEITRVHQHANFWPGILPHGIAELTAIFICGGAGLLLGGALLLPGRYRRAEAFRKAGLESIYLVLGSIPLFVFAGIVEGMFSHLGLPGWLRLTFAGVNGVLWYCYLFVPRRRPDGETALPGLRNSAFA
jgi:uncharacterized membrane protein SpoIIM required for sporulation